MADGHHDSTIDLLRWSFAVGPENAVAIEEHLLDMGLDVIVRDESQFVVLWDEPEGDLDAVIEALWAMNGEPFEITQEEFHRQNLLHVHHEDEADGSGTDERAVA